MENSFQEFLDKNKDKIRKKIMENTPKNAEGKTVIAKDDEDWRTEED